MATAAASVAMARFMPRTRTAGTPATRPTARPAMVAARMGENGEATFQSADNRIIAKAATPASAIGMREICPT